MHDAHVFFENSAADDGYYRSEASVVAPSELEINRGKVPVENDHFKSPPNCLRLKWKSGPGGDWHVRLKGAEVLAHNPEFDGDTLSIWCYATEELKPDDAPRIFLQDDARRGCDDNFSAAGREARPAGKWTEVRLPFAAFSGRYGGTEDERFNARRVASLTMLQNFEDNPEHTLFIDDISIVDGNARIAKPPDAPRS